MIIVVSLCYVNKLFFDYVCDLCFYILFVFFVRYVCDWWYYKDERLWLICVLGVEF